jgi:hypothetical protein
VFTQRILSRHHSIAAIAVSIPEKRSKRDPQKALLEMPPHSEEGRQSWQNAALRTPVSLHRKERSQMVLNPDYKVDAPFF